MNIQKQTFADLRSQDFEDVIFSGCTLISTEAREAKFIDCAFQECIISSVKFDGAVLQVEFKNSKIEGVNFFTAKREILSLSFEGCLVRYSSFAELKLKETRFKSCVFQHVDFADADLSGSDFSDSKFEECKFRNTNLSKANFQRAIGYTIDPTLNKVKGAKFDVPEVLALLAPFGIVIE